MIRGATPQSRQGSHSVKRRRPPGRTNPSLTHMDQHFLQPRNFSRADRGRVASAALGALHHTVQVADYAFIQVEGRACRQTVGNC